METRKDDILIERILEGDTEAYRGIVERYGERVFSLVRRIVPNPQDAEELTSDVFLKVFQRLGKFRGESKFSTWLYRIAYNTAVSYTRKKRLPTAEIDERVHSTADAEDSDLILQEARLQELEKAIGRLAAPDVLLIELFYIQRLPVKAIAAITGQEEGNIKVRLFRIRKRLATIIKEDYENDRLY